MNNEVRNKITARTIECWNLANQKLGRDYPYPHILFDLRGTTAGEARGNRIDYKIRYNEGLAVDNLDYFLTQNIPHEISHLIAFLYYPHRIKPHGKEWRHIMRSVFGVEPKRCHDLDTSNCRARKSYIHIYACACGKELRVGSKHHNAIQQNKTVFHKTCRLAISRAWYKKTVDRATLAVV